MNLADLHNLGFENSKHIPFTRHFKVRCNSCEALVIMGVPCHEGGCPEVRVKCRECGQMIRRGGCECQDMDDGEPSTY